MTIDDLRDLGWSREFIEEMKAQLTTEELFTKRLNQLWEDAEFFGFSGYEEDIKRIKKTFDLMKQERRSERIKKILGNGRTGN